MLNEELVPHAQEGRFDAAGFTDRERMAMRYAELMHTSPGSMTDEFMSNMRSVFTDPEVVELGIAVAQFIGMGQLIHMLGLPNPTRV